jgi:hypothetical protein
VLAPFQDANVSQQPERTLLITGINSGCPVHKAYFGVEIFKPPPMARWKGPDHDYG